MKKLCSCCFTSAGVWMRANEGKLLPTICQKNQKQNRWWPWWQYMKIAFTNMAPTANVPACNGTPRVTQHLSNWENPVFRKMYAHCFAFLNSNVSCWKTTCFMAPCVTDSTVQMSFTKLRKDWTRKQWIPYTQNLFFASRQCVLLVSMAYEASKQWYDNLDSSTPILEVVFFLS